jgi:catechol 2,3-dioxygenase-like lactoylglutathione lyase family enzyme
MITNILCDDLMATRNTFGDLLDFNADFESDWFISMNGPRGERIGLFSRTSEFIPLDFQHHPQGVIITILVDEVDQYFEKARTLGLRVVEGPRDLPYGQRRMLVHDPSGILIDISAPTAAVDPDFLG